MKIKNGKSCLEEFSFFLNELSFFLLLLLRRVLIIIYDWWFATGCGKVGEMIINRKIIWLILSFFNFTLVSVNKVIILIKYFFKVISLHGQKLRDDK